MLFDTDLAEAATMLRTLDWTDLAAITHASTPLLAVLDARRDTLHDLVVHAIEDDHLSGLHEHYDILDKLVLHDDTSGWRLRLHVFAPGYFDRPHNHRWTYTSRILAGSYTHTLYGSDELLGDRETIDPAQLTPRMVRTETTGDTYTLQHTMIHAITAQPHTTSLIVRGPAVKDRFLVTDQVTGHSWWQYGAAHESPETAAAKRMTPQRARATLRRLREHGVLGPATEAASA
ncbi:hypothetical protein GCM10012275_43320 [Longimycelium tulufanense]|uniref:Cysteine dioxygenase n=1 Tax=Longimycelium tulufanense TaxID=907463 RepID=A0A8J3FW15_9PSEU|nr:hypothetical protein [Longimycelium tulufanense]GGM68117.1 hypothetical protein GCM10012275_43320 [Longimycelium tulufanense]